MILTQERLRELFDYQDGNLVRKTSPAPNAQIGDIAGCLSGGYLRTRVDGEQYPTIALYGFGTMDISQRMS